MSNNLFDFLKQIQDQIQEKSYSYVYFDVNTNKIERITNRKETFKDLEFIKVETNDLRDIFNGVRKFEDYKVLYNTQKQDFELMYVQQGSRQKINYQKINDKVFKISQVVDPKIDLYHIIVQQNNKQNCWNFFVNKSIKIIENVNNNLFFSITAKNDPNILYRTMTFQIDSKIDECIRVPYIYPSEKDIKNTSVYTNKVFNIYAHEVLND